MVPPVLCLILTAAAAHAAADSDWEVDWSSIDGGGEISQEGGPWNLSGATGQWDASAASGIEAGPWSITGGFWSVARESDTLFKDGFEAGVQAASTAAAQENPR